jgi:hypothetical protein
MQDKGLFVKFVFFTYMLIAERKDKEQGTRIVHANSYAYAVVLSMSAFIVRRELIGRKVY